MPYDSANKRLYIDRTDSDNPLGISPQEVSLCLQDYRVDTNGNVDVGMMCSSPKINPHAKFKPVRYPSWEHVDGYWRAADGMCGFDLTDAKVGNTADLSGIHLKYSIDGQNGWKYAAPRGGASEPFRLDDFDGYDHNVEAFVAGYTMPYVWAIEDGNLKIEFKVTEPGNDAAPYLSYKDLKFEDYYLGVALRNATTGAVVRRTNEQKIEAREDMSDTEAQSGFRIEIPAEQIPVGNYVAFPFLSTAIIQMNDPTTKVASIYTVPNVRGEELTIVPEVLTVRMEGSLTLLRLPYKITLINNTQSDRTYTSNEFRVRYASAAGMFLPSLSEDENACRVMLDDITVPAESSVTISGQVAVSAAMAASELKMWLSLNGSAKIYSQSVQQNITPDA